MVDLGEDEDKFDAFMLPLTTAFESLGAVLAAGGYNSEEVEIPICSVLQPKMFIATIFSKLQVRKTVIGLARDLRGVAFAFNTKVKTYGSSSNIPANFVHNFDESHYIDTLISDFLHDAL